MISIRPYAAADRTAAAQVFYRAVREGTARHYTEAQRAAWAPSPEPDARRPDRLLDQICLVAEDDGRMLGFMSLTHAGYLDMAFVLPEVMGQGVASALYDELARIARARAMRHLTVRASHLARSFFARRGWQVEQRVLFEADGQVYEVFDMSVTLPAA